jgi:nucleoside-diphosphate-sugar epimerase
MRYGLFKFIIGSLETRCDWVHVDNVVQAHLRAADKLLSSVDHPTTTTSSSSSNGSGSSSSNGSSSDSGSGSRGEPGAAYFISDGDPHNNFEVLRPLADAMKVPFPSMVCPPPLSIIPATCFRAVSPRASIGG